MTGRDNYQAWRIDEKDFPSRGTIEEQIRFFIGYGVLAPSIHNSQPWQFEIDNQQLTILPRSDSMVPHSDPVGRGLQFSLGCCVMNIEVAAEHFGLKTESHWSADGITLRFRKHVANENSELFDAITKRYSAKLPYERRPLTSEQTKRLASVKSSGASHLTLLTDPAQISRAAKTQRIATLSYAGKRAFFKELSQWLRLPNTTSEDGMPGFVIGASNAQSRAMKPLLKHFRPIIKVMAKKDSLLVDGSAAAGFITTKGDTPREWFDAGRHYELLALKVAASGLAMAPLAAMIENPQVRAELPKVYGLPGRPQIFFRIGYSKHKPLHTPRRNNLSKPYMETQKQLAKTLGIPVKFSQTHIGTYVINYIVAGEGRPVLLLHGANIGWPQWYQNIAELAKHFKVYALDLPGAGNSTVVDFHKMEFEEYTQIVDNFVNTHKLTGVDIVGSSFGGWIAMRLAIDHKPYISRVVLTNPLGLTTYMPAKFRPVSVRPLAVLMTKTALRPKPGNKNLEKFMRDVFFDKQLPLAPEFINYFYELSAKSHNLLFISRLAHFKGMRKELYLKKDLHKIDKPVLLIWGKEDQLMPFATIVDSIKEIPGVTLETLDKIGHMPPVETPEVFNKMTIDFLKR